MPERQGRFDHVAVAVRSIPDALRLFRDALGGVFVSGGDDDRLGIRTIQYRLPPGIKIELMEPLRENSPLQRFLDKRGEGLHHLTVFFEDIEHVIPAFGAAGFTAVDTDLSDPGWRETYLRPRDTFGTLIQMVDTNRDWSQPVPGVTEAAVLAGRVVWKGSRPVLRDPLTGSP